MSAIESRKKVGVTNCRIQQIWKAKRMMFWKGFLRLYDGEVVKLTSNELQEARAKQKKRRKYKIMLKR